MVVFGQSGCIRPKVFVFGKAIVFGQIWWYSGIPVIFDQCGCNRAKVVVIGQSG